MSYKKRLTMYFANSMKDNKFRTTETVYVNDEDKNTVMQTIIDNKKAKVIKAYYNYAPINIPDALKDKNIY